MNHKSYPLVPCVVLIAAVMDGTALRAHEIGTTRVAVVFQDGQPYHIDVVTDAASLVEKLQAAGGEASSAPVDPAALQSRLVTFNDLFRRRIKVTFDGAEVRPDIAYTVPPAIDSTSPVLATIRLTGELPRNSRRFTWTYGWTFASYALTLQSRGRGDTCGAPTACSSTEWLEGGQTSTPFALTVPAPSVSRMEIAWRYLVLGFTHILPKGLDHMLFVLGIFLLSGRARSVLWQVSAFTVAHSITLGLSMYGLITVAPSIVEPLIALSIAYVAIENLFVSELKSWRIALVFAFGLLHGMGFAGALKELGLPRSEFVTALVAFNSGVEGGQLTVIAAAFLLVGWQCGGRDWYRRRIVVPGSAVIACTAVYWTIQRMAF